MIDPTASPTGVRSRTGRLTLWIVLLLVVGIGGLAVYWAKYGQLDTASPTAEVQKAPAPAPASPPPRAEASEEAMKAVTALQETIKDLQSLQKHLQDRVERVEMQLSKAQGESKMLSEQVGALSSRVDGLSTPPPASTGGISQLLKRNARHPGRPVRGPETTHNTLPEPSAELEIAFAQNHIWAMAKWLRMILIILGIFVVWATLSVMTFDDRVRVDYQQFVR